MTAKKIVIVAIVVAVVLAIGVLYGGWFHRDSGLQGSGTVEARNIRVGSKVGGRIDKLLVREGDNVEAGQVLMTFDDQNFWRRSINPARMPKKPNAVIAPRKLPKLVPLHCRPKPITN